MAPRASAAVRPGSPAVFGGQPESLADDFGASNGYAGHASGVYGAPPGGNTYGAANTHGTSNDDFDSDEYNGYGAPQYGADQSDYGYGEADGYGERGGYEFPHEPDAATGDPNYKARRHRPSANDTNVGSLSDFAQYGGYTPDQEHYGRR